MFIKLILALALFIGISLLFRIWRKLPKEKKRAQLIKWGLIALFVVCLLAVVTGRAHWLMAVLSGLLAAFKLGFHTLGRALPFLGWLKHTNIFGSPRFKTPFLDIQVDLKTGTATGNVIEGPMKGENLASLSQDQLQELETYYQQHDKRSYYLIRALRQRAGHQYEKQDKQYASSGDPSVDEAIQILGLEPNPSREDVIKAHRSLMQKLHPDRGGNDYLASRVNLAKEVLLKHLDKN